MTTAIVGTATRTSPNERGWHLQSNLATYKADIERLYETGTELLASLVAQHAPAEFEKAFKDAEAVRNDLPEFQKDYQAWYSEALVAVKLLLPDRLEDFIRHYEAPKNRRELTLDNYRIEDALRNLSSPFMSYNPMSAYAHVEQQVEIVGALQRRLESSLFDIRQLVLADLMDSELDAARELTKKGFHRAAGAIAGVVLEKHLAQVCSNHKLKIAKKNPTISNFNDALKDANVVEIPQWRQVQHLGDLRNLCDHGKGKEPTADDAEDLIKGVTKLTKTLF